MIYVLYMYIHCRKFNSEFNKLINTIGHRSPLHQWDSNPQFLGLDAMKSLKHLRNMKLKENCRKRLKMEII